MFYIIGLFLILTLILSGFTGTLPFSFGLNNITAAVSNVLGSFKQKTVDLVFPKSENEILINNLKSNYDLLDKFFSSPETIESILSSEDISKEDKSSLKQASKAFKETGDQIKQLGDKAIKNEPGIIKSFTKKVLGLDQEADNNGNSPNPTHIPPNCNLVCQVVDF